MTRLGLVLVLAAVAFTAACGQGMTIVEQPTPPLRGTTWDAVGMTEDGRTRPPAPQTRIRITFADDGTIGLEGGCNRISGPVTITGDRLEAGELTQTDLGCEQARLDQDQWLADFVGTGPRWRETGAGLVLSTGRIRITLVRHSPAGVPFVGTRWIVDGLVNGTGDDASVGSVPAGVEASLTFDGTHVTGSTGCNRLTGPATVDGQVVALGPLATTKMACGGPADAVERSVLNALTPGPVRAVVTGDTLRLTNAAAGLILKAAP
ncbi:META domain-containing protein [Cryptosporangium sp. NPDC051539]|uniref:META domain-containing protein n=1 Tax=Cryptosporangium sp. NPDC051539 TaxID=3363962 RepID=UPI0037A11EAA